MMHNVTRMRREADVPMDAMETQILDRVDRPDIILPMLEAARAQPCGTVVVGQESWHGLQALVRSHGSDMLLCQRYDLTVWVVE